MVANEKWFGGAGATTGMYSHQILHSCRFDASASSRLYRTFGTPSSTTKFSISFWIKIPNIPGYSQIFSKDNGYAGGGAAILLEDDLGGGAGTVNIMTMYGMAGSSGGNTGANTYPPNTFTDNTGWYHIHYKADTSKSGMSGNNAKVVMHINGVLAVFQNTNEPSGNWTRFNDASAHSIGNGSSGTQGDKYLAEFIFLDGQYEDYTSFGSFVNGIWTPDDPSGLNFSGNNSFHLKFENASDLGNDSSSNNNDFSSTGLTASNQTLDSPTFSES